MLRKITLFAALLTTAGVYGQNGKISGKIIDAENGMEMMGASVFIAGTYKGVSSDLDGNYMLDDIEPGTYDLVCKFISYSDDTIKGLVLKPGGSIFHDFTLGQNVQMVQEAVVEVKETRNNVQAIDRMKAKSAGMLDGMSSQTIQKAGDSDVASAAKRVTGVSVEGGKYLYVRGLSDRYSKTMLNGAEIPGLDPNRNSVQLDLFPTALVENMTVTKTFTADLPASFTGGLVNIETKDFPDEQTTRASVTLGYNSNATYNSNFRTYQGGKYDLLGFDDGTRQVPDAVKGNTVPFAPSKVPDNSAEAQKLSAMTQSFNKVWATQNKAPMNDVKFSVSTGDNKSLKNGSAIGYNAALTYSHYFEHYDNGVTGRYNLLDSTSKVLNTNKLLKDSRSDENVLWGALLNTSFKINSRNRIGLVLLRNQNGIASARFQEGKDNNLDPDFFYQSTTLRYLQRSLNTAQLKGLHEGGLIKTNWILSYAYATQQTPDLRTFESHYERMSDGSKKYDIDGAAYNEPNRYFRDMNEYNLDAKVNFELPLNGADNANASVFKFGGSQVIKKRHYTETRYDFESKGVQFNGSPADYFSNDNMDATSSQFLYLRDLTDSRNTYDADERVGAAYAMVDYKFNPVFRVALGVRIEKSLIQAISEKYYEATTEIAKADLKGVLDNLDVLPSLNVSYALNEKSNLRAAVTRTLARPAFRELAPFASYDFDYQFVKIGNPALQRTLVDNLDLRYEIFPNSGELISFSAYYKHFDGPIELVTNPEAPNLELTWKNQEYAHLYGAEFEFRKNLAFVSQHLDNFSFGFNASYIYSATKIDPKELANIRATDPGHADTRSMFGQSPYLVNSHLGYTSDSADWNVYVTFNVSGPKMVLVTDGGTPDVYEQPKHTVDVSLMKKLGNLEITLRAKNLLNAQTAWMYQHPTQNYYFQRYDTGRQLSLTAAYRF